MKDDSASIVFPPAGKFYGKDLNRVKAALAAELKGRVKAAYLFGSAAQDGGSYYSDIDLILVKEGSAPVHRRAFDFSDPWDIYAPLDVLVYTPGEFEKICASPDTPFLKDMVRQMVPLNML
jgi:predicted nucleotidyltransferase